MSFYAYMRVSTTKQDTLRQREAILDYCKSKSIDLKDDDFYVDYYTGKTFDREQYQNMKSKLTAGDYIIVKEVDRLGRDWDGIKNEWKQLKDCNINIIIIDVPILSDALPNELQPIEGLDLRLIKEQILSLMCYTAQKEREKISQRTKEALAQKKIYGTNSGKPIGRPRSDKATRPLFIKTLERMVNEGIGQDKASILTGYPNKTFKKELRDLYVKYNTTDYKTILENLKS